MKIGTTRVETFSDGVIAIIMTIMVMSMKVPEFNHKATTYELLGTMKHLVPYIITYTFSFLMIGIYWINHHHMFHLLEKTDERLLQFNLLFLFWISLIPLATAMLGANPFVSLTTAAYGSVLLLTTFTYSIMRNYTLKNGLVHKDADPKMNNKIFGVSRRARTKSLMGTLAYLLSIPFAFVSVYISYICFIIPPIIFFIPDGIDDEKLAEKISEKNG